MTRNGKRRAYHLSNPLEASNARVRARVPLFMAAIAALRAVAVRGGDIATEWVPELAPLDNLERATVRRALAEQIAAKAAQAQAVKT